jgi:hypothetical protein
VSSRTDGELGIAVIGEADEVVNRIEKTMVFRMFILTRLGEI